MKQNVWNYLTQSTITIIILIFGFFIYGKIFGPISISINQKNPQKTFQVVGKGEIEVKPDLIQTQFSIQEDGLTRDEVQKKGNDKNNAALKALLALGIEEKNITTTNYSINPNYDFRNNRIIIGYTIYIGTAVKSQNKDKMARVIDKLTALGLNPNGLTYLISDEERYKSKARELAIENAKKKAKSLADAADFKLGEIASIKELEEPIFIRPLMGGSQIKTTESLQIPTNIEQGQEKITDQIEITYYIR